MEATEQCIRIEGAVITAGVDGGQLVIRARVPEGMTVALATGDADPEPVSETGKPRGRHHRSQD